MSKWMRRLLLFLTQACICTVLILSPLALGAVEPWAFSILACLAYTALACAVVRVIITRSVRRLWVPMVVPLALGLILVGLQYARWPVGLLERVSPQTVRLYRQAARADTDASYFENLFHLSPSLYRNATRDALVCFSAYVALFLATVASVRSERQLSRYAGAAVIGGFLTSLIGILQKASNTQQIFWLVELRWGGRFFGPFVSRNQFASYAGVCIFAGLGLVLARRSANINASREWRDNLRKTVERREQLNLLTGFAVAVMAAAVVWSLSRAGTAALLLSLVGVGIAVKAVGILRKPVLIGLIGLVLVAGVVLYLGVSSVVTRVEQTRTEVSTERLGKIKWTLFRDGLRMGARHPALGTGAGTFLSAYPYYRTIRGDTRAHSPENEYIHVFAEAGYPGAVLMLAAMAIAYLKVIRALAIRRNPYALGYLCGGLGVLLMLTLHSALDFPMRSPAIAATVAVLLGTLCRASVVRRRRQEGPEGEAATDSDDIFASSAFREDGPTGFDGEPVEQRSLAEIQRAMRDRSLNRRRRYREPVGASGAAVAALAAFLVWLPLCHFALNPLRGEMALIHIRKNQGKVGPPTRRDREGGTEERAPASTDDNGDPDQLKAFVGDVMDFVRLREEEIRQHSPDDAALWTELAEFVSRAAELFNRHLDTLESAGTIQRLREKAVQMRLEAMRREPLNTRHRFGLALGYYFLGRPGYAAMHADQSCALQPGDPWIRALYAREFAALGDVDTAEHFLQEAVRAAQERGTDEADDEIAKARVKIESARRRLGLDAQRDESQ